MATELRVPVARHPRLGTIVADQLADQDDTVRQLDERHVRDELTCGSCGGAVVFVNATQKVRHFRHRADAECVWGPESSRHLAIKEAFAQAFTFWGAGESGAELSVEVTVELPRESERLWQADVACIVRDRKGATKRMMVEVQQSPQSAEVTAERTARRHADGWDVLWVHYDPEDSRAPWWLTDAAPALGVTVTDTGGILLTEGILQRYTVRTSDITTLRMVPGDEDVVEIDDWVLSPIHLTSFIGEWIRSAGLLTDPIDGRPGLAWVHPPASSPLDPSQRIFADTYDVFAWQREMTEAKAEARRQAEEQSQVERLRALEEQRSLIESRLAPLRDLLNIRPPRPAKYPKNCFTCGNRIAPGQPAAMMTNELIDQWGLFCGACTSLLGLGSATSEW